MQTLEQMMDEEPTSGMSEEEDGRKVMVGNVNLLQHFYRHWRVAAVRKYIMFGVLIT